MLTHRTATLIGDIPEDWSRDSLVQLLADQKGGDWGQDDGEVGVRVLRSTNFTNGGMLNFADVAVRYFDEAKATTMKLERNDLLLERSGGGPTQPVGRIGFITDNLPGHWFSNFVQLLRPDPIEIDPEFLGWLLLRVNQSGVVERLQHQTTQMRNLDFRDYLRVWLPKPKPEEQRQISAALRTATDALAGAETKLRAARQLKLALMQKLFTQGIPGRHAQMKETGVGKVPATWAVARIRSVLDGMPFNGVSPQSRPEPPGTPILNVECVDDGICSTEHISYVDVDERTRDECRARKGDFYVIRGNGNRDYVAAGGLLLREPDVPTIFSDKLIRLRFQVSKVVERFVPYLWQSSAFLRRIQSKAECGSGLWMMGKRDIRRELFAYPTDLNEQSEMVELIDSAIDNIAACEREVVALRRVKHSLLQNLLTGRVRVRS